MMSRKTCSRLSLPTNVSKVHLHMEQFSLKTDWQADSFMIMAVRKTGKAGEEGKRRGRLRPVFLEGIQKRREVTCAQRHLGVSGSSRILVAPEAGSDPSRTCP